MSNICFSCPYYSMCKKGYVIDCSTGEVLDSPDYESGDIGSSTIKELNLQNDNL